MADTKNTHSLIDPRPALSVPTLDLTTEQPAHVENTIIVILVVSRPCQAVPKHPLGQRREGFDGVILEESSRRGRIPFRCRVVSRSTELIKLILGCDRQLHAPTPKGVGVTYHPP